MQRWWANLPETIQRRLANFIKASARPNKLETDVQSYLDAHFPGEWKYNKGEFVIAGRVPDFVNINGRKAVIEVFGDYWHRGEDPRKKRRHYAAAGYACTVIWERTFRHSPHVLGRAVQGAGENVRKPQ